MEEIKIKQLIKKVSYSYKGDDANYFKDLSWLIDDTGVMNLIGSKFYITNYGILLMDKQFKYCDLTDEELKEESLDKNKAWICLKLGEKINLMCSDWEILNLK